MILKSLSRKGKRGAVKQLLNYMFQEHKKGDSVVLHNIHGSTVDEYANAFIINEHNRKYIRKNTNVIMHDIISMHHLDSPKITKSMLRKIAKEYIKLRNPNALYVIVPHYDRKSIHLHIAMSGVEQFTGLSTRMSQNDFRELKIVLQNKFPELKHSIVEHDKKKRKVSEKEFQVKKRTGTTEKEKTKKLLDKIYKQSYSKKDFYTLIQNNGLFIYERNGKPWGIIGKNKMRFSTLGFDDNKLNNFDLMQEFENLNKGSASISHNMER